MTVEPLVVPFQSGAGGVAFLGFLFVVTWIVALVWVYSDAKANSPHSPFLWTLVVFFGGLLGLVLYLILGRSGSAGGGGHHAQY